MLYHIISFSLLALFIFFGKPLAAQEKINLVKTAFEITQSETSIPSQATFKDKNGNQVLLSSFQGKVIVLNFFKPNCRPCLLELPSLNRLAESFKEMPVVILTVAEGEKNAEIVEKVFYERRLNNLTIALDENEQLLRMLGGEKVPRTLLINAQGRIIGTLQGQADFSSSVLINQIKEAL